MLYKYVLIKHVYCKYLTDSSICRNIQYILYMYSPRPPLARLCPRNVCSELTRPWHKNTPISQFCRPVFHINFCKKGKSIKNHKTFPTAIHLLCLLKCVHSKRSFFTIPFTISLLDRKKFEQKFLLFGEYLAGILQGILSYTAPGE
jgi:hypothetical protein